MSAPRLVKLRPTVDADIVDLCKKLLAMAKRGEFLTFGYIVVRKGGVFGTGYTGLENGHLHATIAASAVLQHRLCHEAMDIAEEGSLEDDDG